ncbi:hypothetical protein FA09DRAFT_137274 [Tilletiopsis washingtonensis]|uniref:Uncharacterized protein n=1 Tax=Tilletiopsis washingtonensis TaxID=58919 RepID=A0A316Z2A3_9BASI|nr:hypothetical protein FA09DRAFT_137274 [Tilletiopsis washingtonensis]PWN95689.1 hypothetical protein FA09DRAFT_137274 [Tilletiopsis washingtonensis]
MRRDLTRLQALHADAENVESPLPWLATPCRRHSRSSLASARLLCVSSRFILAVSDKHEGRFVAVGSAQTLRRPGTAVKRDGMPSRLAHRLFASLLWSSLFSSFPRLRTARPPRRQVRSSSHHAGGHDGVVRRQLRTRDRPRGTSAARTMCRRMANACPAATWTA